METEVICRQVQATTALSTLCQGRLYPHIDLYIYIYLKVELINKTTFSLPLNFTLTACGVDPFFDTVLR